MCIYINQNNEDTTLEVVVKVNTKYSQQPKSKNSEGNSVTSIWDLEALVFALMMFDVKFIEIVTKKGI